MVFAVDEAQCISEWLVSSIACPPDFRKSFKMIKMIGRLRALLSAPFMALSASALPDVEAEISLLTLTPLQSSCVT